ncbi:MAG: sigma-54-dependent Fis family transcriptional regulator [Myxococcales bacterium]|nr:sigma-54-dependent Fis family transcriptional regulator [Myxococcales bacterium]
MTDRVLVVDDETNMRKVLRALLRRAGLEVHTAADGLEALDVLGAGPDFSMVLTDLRMPVLDGMGLLERVQKRWPDLPVVLLTAHGTVDTAVEAMKRGAFDFVTKPFDQDELLAVVRKALATGRLALESAPSDASGAPTGRFGLIGSSGPMQRVFDIVEKVAATPSTVLITGESGTGKELIAKALHTHSPRASKPYIRVNCAAIPDTLIESELFGYEKGAFTGAVTSKPGRFELADQGTLFLDEIGEISTEMQVKLLRAIQESEFERVGGVTTRRVDVRLVTATNRDLAQRVQAGEFRDDLYYRLNVVPIPLPPLRERAGDIPLLVDHLMERYAQRLGRTRPELSEDAAALMHGYEWPGNIRELENVIERTLLFCDGGRITAADLPAELRGGEPLLGRLSLPIPPVGATGLKDAVRRTTQRLEREMIEQALRETGGNVTRAARTLAISRKSLQTKMKEFGLRDED